MTRKRTLYDYALWAVLPMAHTSKVERRIKMILDSTRRRTSPRRFLLIAAMAGAAAIVPLAMLQPGAKAQSASVSGQDAAEDAHGIQLLGIANPALPGSNWWDKNGNTLPIPALGANLTPRGITTTAFSGEKALLIAFHLPASLQNKPLVYDVPGTMGSGVTITSPRNKLTSRTLEFQMHNGVAAYEAAFSLSQAKTDVQIGVATGLGAETVNCLKKAGKVYFQRPSGEVVFNLVPNPRHLPAAQAARGYALFVVSDHFRRPSPRKTSLISSLDGSLQMAQHDGENYDRAVYALDNAGRVVTKLSAFSHTWPDEASRPGDNSLMKTQQIAHIPRSLLKRVASFRLVARPYQWTEFKDVALEPIKP